MTQASTFAERFAYVRFLYHLERGRDPGNAEIGRAVARVGSAVTGWTTRDTPPPDFLDGKPLHDPLVEFFKPTGVTKDWLIAGKGEPPRAKLWEEWLDKRRKEPAYLRVAERLNLDVAGTDARRPPKRRRRAR